MKDSTKILILLGGLAALGLVIYFATQGSSTPSSSTTGPSGGFAGLVRSIGAGLTGITAAVVGTVEEEEARAERDRAETEAEEESGT